MENHPGNPPQPPAPGNPPQPPGQPTYPSALQAPQVVYLQPGQQIVYVQSQPGQQTPMPAPGYNQGQWVYQQPYAQAPVLAPSSGWRIAAGILGIGVGLWSMTVFFIMVFPYGMAMSLVGFLLCLLLICGLGAVSLGIMVTIKHRDRSKPIPTMLLGFSTGVALVHLVLAVMDRFAPGMAIVSIIGALPVIVLSIYVLTGEAAATRAK